MKKRCKTLPKHVRLVCSLLAGFGAVELRCEVNGRYIVSWCFAGIAMRVSLPLSPGGNVVEAARGNIRRLFRQHGFSVPA